VIALESSNLAAVDYDGWSGTLTIEFHDGAVYPRRRPGISKTNLRNIERELKLL
jgi:hypothetical protein